MHSSNIVFLINDDIRAIRGKYDVNDGPTLFKTLDQTIAVGDMVVVQSGTRFNMTVVKVTEVDVDLDYDANAEVKWVVQKIDTDGFHETIDRENEAIAAVQAAERRRKKAELRQTMFKDHEETINHLALSNQSDTPIIE